MNNSQQTLSITISDQSMLQKDNQIVLCFFLLQRKECVRLYHNFIECMRKYMFRVFVSSNKETNIESTPMWISLPIHFEGMDGGGCCVVEWWCSSSSAGVNSQWQQGSEGAAGELSRDRNGNAREHTQAHTHNTQRNAPEHTQADTHTTTHSYKRLLNNTASHTQMKARGKGGFVF